MTRSFPVPPSLPLVLFAPTEANPTGGTVSGVLALPAAAHAALISHLLGCYPLEGCGLLAGRVGEDGTTEVAWFAPCDNVAESSKLYTVDPRAHLAADRRAEDEGLAIVGVVHSHTHTEPYPSPTDIAQAPDPTWHYIIVSFRLGAPMVRSWRLVDGAATEERVEVIDA